MLQTLWGKGPWFGSTRICSAAESDDLGTVKAMATQYPELVNQKGWMGWAPLHKAAQAGSAEVAQFLVTETKFECDVNIRDSENHTPLHLACGVPADQRKQAHAKVVQILLENGADANAEDEGGYTPLHLAALQNNLVAAKLLLDHGAAVNKLNGDKFTALHSAVRSQFGDLATLLLNYGADFAQPDGKGRTPLQLAQRVGMKLQIDDSVMRKQPGAVSALGAPQSTPKKPALPPANDVPSGPPKRPESIPVAQSSPVSTPEKPKEASPAEVIDDATAELQKAIEDELAE